MRPVLNKLDFVDRFIAGEFGNRSINWGTLEEYVASGFNGLTHVRNRLAGGDTWYDVPTIEVARVWAVVARKYGERYLYLSAMGPEYLKTFQGEAIEMPGGLYLHWTDLPLPMRDGLRLKSRHSTGAESLWLLHHYLCPNSLEWLSYLLREYDGHVIEFSAYSKPVGILPNFNTMFWEVRKY